MKIVFNKVTWYSKLLAIILFLLVAFISFFLGKWLETTKIPINLKTDRSETIDDQNININLNASPAPSPKPSTKPTPKPASPTPYSSPINTNLSCNKPTIVLSVLKVSREQADLYFLNHGFTIYEEKNATQTRLLVNVGIGNDAFWINKIESDGIGVAGYDNFGCDFR